MVTNTITVIVKCIELGARSNVADATRLRVLDDRSPFIESLIFLTVVTVLA